MRWVWLFALGCVTRGELETALDRDGDGYQPVVAGGPDCDETRSDVNPGAVEACGDGIDNDCDGRIDDAGIGERTWFRDDDDDGFGVDETVQACSEPEGYAPVLGDCADQDPGINPGVLDLCDGIDQDCDGRIDDDVDALVQYRDADGDGFGTDDDTLTGCGQTPGYVLVSGDCDDATPSINPAVEDTCDGVDQNCNGVVDEDVVFTVQYRDVDGDGDGNPLDLISACELLPGYVGTANDCDDADPHRYTNAFDHCDGIDQDCDGLIDNDVDFVAYYIDHDGDGAGTEPAVTESCEPVPTLVTTVGDCDDHDPTISPLLADTCDGVDSDCDGAIDDDALLTLYFPDSDGDGVGTTLSAVEACIPPEGFVQLDGDCDDHDPGIRPDSVDACDGIDTDCDGAVDDDASFALWWNDGDGDGVGAGPSTYSCDPPPGAASVDGDCADDDPNVRPGLTDTCDGLDQDCDGAVDEDAPFGLWWADEDGDGAGTGAPVYVCQAPDDAAQAGGDCDDSDPNVRPGIVDGCDGTDSDCDGVVDQDATFALWFRDADGDGMGRTDLSVSACDGAPPGYVGVPGDCDDADGDVTIPVWYRDQDGDGWGTEEALVGCTQPSGFASQLGDCEDDDELRNPGLVEVCNNHRDDDCDAETDCRRLGTLLPAHADYILPVPLDVEEVELARGIPGGTVPDLVLSFPDRVEVHSDGVASNLMAAPAWTIPACRAGTLSLDPNAQGTAVVCQDVADSQLLRLHRRGAVSPDLTFTAPGVLVSGFEGVPHGGCGPGFWIQSDEGTQFISQVAGATSPADAVSTFALGPHPHLEPVTLADGSHALLVQTETGALGLFDDTSCPPVRNSADALATVHLDASTAVVQHQPEYDIPVYAAFRIIPGEPAFADTCVWEEPPSPANLAPYHNTCFYGDALNVFGALPMGDLDDDGQPDWVVLPQEAAGVIPLTLVYGESGVDPDLSATSFIVAVPGQGTPNVLAPGDLDGDGYADLLFHLRLPHASSLYVFLGRGP